MYTPKSKRMENHPTYLVPFDFSPIGDNAIAHALHMAKITNGAVTLLHVVKHDRDVFGAQERLQRVAAEVGEGNDIKVSPRIVVGSIFEDIGKFAESMEAQLIVMGTHGARGLQKVFGSYAIRVITSSSVPFVVTQEKEPQGSINTIVMPINLTKESIQVMKFAVDLAKKFDAEVHVLGEAQSDDWLQNKVKSNMLVARKYFAKNGIRSQVSILEGKDSYEQEVVDYGLANNADLFAIAYFTESLLPQFDTFAQSVITNDPQIPVLVINAQEVMLSTTQFSFIAV